MPMWPHVRSLVRTLVGGARLDRELDDEMHAYVDELTERHMREGMTPVHARRAALLACEGVEQTKQRVRETRIGAGIDSTLQDLRLGWRGLRRQPGFTAVAITTLALGIGANVAVFSVVRAVLLRPLPYADASRLVFVWDSDHEQPLTTMPPARLTDLRERASTLSGVAGIAHTAVTLIGQGDPERVLGASVSSNFFQVLGVNPAMGRTFRPGSEREHTVVLSHGLWTRHYAADPAIIGRSIILGDAPWTVIGVMPADFVWPTTTTGGPYHGPNPELWLPAPRREIPAFPADFPGDYTTSRSISYLRAVARIAPGVSDAAVANDMAALSRQLSTEHAADRTRRFVAVSAINQIAGSVRQPLLVLLDAVVMVLIIACANVANLILARTLARRGEISVRMALGAGRRRLVRQFVTESLLLTAVGATIGVTLARITLGTLVALCPADILRLQDTRIDPMVMLFAVGLALATGVVLGLVPLMQMRNDVANALNEAGRGASRLSTRFRGLLVAGEVAVAVTLVIGATLLVRSFVTLQAIDVGINRPAGILTFEIFVNGEKAQQDSLRLAFYERVLEALRVLPGVRSAGAAATLPVGGDDLGTAILVEGEPAPVPGHEERSGLQVVTPGYFETMGIPVLAGRNIGASDSATAPRVALVNETFARHHWGLGSALGHRLRVSDRSPWMTIVGTVRDVRHLGPSQPARPEIYLPHYQVSFPFMAFVIRASGDPLSLAPAARRAVAGADPSQSIGDVNTMAGHLRDAMAIPRFLAVITGLFGTLSLLLAGLGIYGVMAWSVAQRRREIGTRLAMGASSPEIANTVFRQGGALVIAGAIAGMASSMALGRVLSTLLHGVSGGDTTAWVAALAAVSFVAGVSLWLPAYRASRVNPVDALRE
jgi:predicted permease